MLSYIQIIIMSLALVIPIVQYYFGWPLSEVVRWPYFIYALVFMSGFFLHLIVTIIGYIIPLAGICWAAIVAIMSLLIYFFPENGTSAILKHLGFELGAGYELLAGLVMAIIPCLIAVYIGRILVKYSHDGLSPSERFEELHIVLKTGTVIAGITLVLGSLLGLLIGGAFIFGFVIRYFHYIIGASALGYFLWRSSLPKSPEQVAQMNQDFANQHMRWRVERERGERN